MELRITLSDECEKLVKAAAEERITKATPLVEVLVEKAFKDKKIIEALVGNPIKSTKTVK